MVCNYSSVRFVIMCKYELIGQQFKWQRSDNIVDADLPTCMNVKALRLFSANGVGSSSNVYQMYVSGQMVWILNRWSDCDCIENTSHADIVTIMQHNVLM